MAINTIGAISEVAISAVNYIFRDSETERARLAKVLSAKLSLLETSGGFWGSIAKFAKSILPNDGTKENEIPMQNLDNNMTDQKINTQRLIIEACEYFKIANKNILPIMMAICQLESGFNPKSLNQKSGATGLFQFTGKSKNEYRKWAENTNIFPNLKTTKDDVQNLGGMFDPKVNVFAGMQLLLNNAKTLNIELNHEMTDQELQDAAIKLYAAHNSGSGNVRAITEALKGDYALMNQQSSKYPWLKGREKYIAKAGKLALDYKNNYV